MAAATLCLLYQAQFLWLTETLMCVWIIGFSIDSEGAKNYLQNKSLATYIIVSHILPCVYCQNVL